MRAIRRINLLSKISADVRFSHSKKVHGSNIWWRGRSFAATVPSDSSFKAQRYQKRISKDERRAMVESFVDKYRVSNKGKYPTPTAVRKEVGGSYYAIRTILQELEYKSKLSPTIRKDSTLLEKLEVPNEECQPSPKIVEVSSSGKTIDLTYEPSLEVKDDSRTIVIDNMERDGAIRNNFEAKERPQLSTQKLLFEEAGNTTGDPSSSIETHIHQIKLEGKNVLHPHRKIPEGSQKKETTFEGSLNINGGTGENGQAAGHGALESDNFGRDISRKENEEEQLPRKSTVWQNLRSFADGVVNFWRKM